MDKINFGAWLKKQREDRELSQSDLARLSGLHRQIINKTEAGVSDPALKTYIALSNALNISLISILRAAGELPPGVDDDIKWEDWKHLINQLTPQEEQNIKLMTEVTIERRQKAEQSARSAKFKPGKVVK